jgi:uncharacterized protein
LTALNQLLAGAFAAAVVFGAAAQAVRLCPQGGLREAIGEGKPERLLTYVAAIGFALLAVAALQLALGQAIVPTRPPYLSPNFAWGRYVAGGLLFGVGMMLARGCPLRMTVLSAQGNLRALVLLAIMAVCAYLFSRTSLFDQAVAPWLSPLAIDLRQAGRPTQGFDALIGATSLPLRMTLGAALGIAIVTLAGTRLSMRKHTGAWLAAVIFGVLVAAEYGLTGGSIGLQALDEASFMAQPAEGLGIQSFTYAGPLSDTIHFLLRPSAATFSVGVVVLLGTVAGALGSAVVRREFALRGLGQFADLPKQAAGAAMTGAGAVVALGCTVGHGLSGIAVLSLGSLLSLAAIFVGAVFVLWLESGAARLRRSAAARA